MSEVKTPLSSDSAAPPAVVGPATQAWALMPRVDVIEDASGITILADLPGVAKENLELKIEGDVLVVSGAMSPFAPGVLEPVYAEVRLSRYRRSFTLSRELDASRTEASLRDGVLKLMIPKQAKAQQRRILIQVT
jgi:HSP20 family protein